MVDVLGRGIVDAFEGAIERGESLSDVLEGLALDMAEIALKTAGNALPPPAPAHAPPLAMAA